MLRLEQFFVDQPTDDSPTPANNESSVGMNQAIELNKLNASLQSPTESTFNILTYWLQLLTRTWSSNSQLEQSNYHQSAPIQTEPINLCLRDTLKPPMPHSFLPSKPLRMIDDYIKPSFPYYTDTVLPLEASTPLMTSIASVGHSPSSSTSSEKAGSCEPSTLTNHGTIKSEANQRIKVKCHPTRNRRRRVGWKGVAECAVCHQTFNGGMDQLNEHYARHHSGMLTMHWDLVQNSSTKVAKMYFQAQLDQLRRESKPVGTTSQQPIDEGPIDVSSHLQSHCQQIDHLSHFNATNNSPSPSLLLQASDHRELKQVDDNSQRCTSRQVCSPFGPLVDDNQSSLEPIAGRRSGSDKRYRCPRCCYTAKWPTELQKHVMVHASIRPFICPVCSTSYKWGWDLGRHFSHAHPTLLNPYKRQKVGAT